MDSAKVLAQIAADAAGGAPPALFLDFDGTLVELAARPDAVAPAPSLVPLLANLSRRLQGALAIVTGRPIAVVDRFLEPLRLPVAGLHGVEMRATQDAARSSPPLPDLAAARARIAQLAEDWPALLVEDKGGAIAVHYRSVPAAGPAVRRLACSLLEDSADALVLIEGKMVVELLPAGRDKGTAILDLCGSAPFAGRRPVFLGDDVTDEAGFHAVNGLGGVSVRIGDGRATAARYRIDNVAGVLSLLGRLESSIGG